ncbi:DUF1684 domain-containing protein [Microbacterium sp. STN6]|uniref:DUF1684 domain-containing protein n=1 Tax=Microbacterium sp. STN6 TaxID=2995588 RepID=UPI002260DBBC|nr:DUF1684 domain-containing protein [Microbacterium sp. STN6]MCX7522353.1 DUF1684 domain-containing protein [Microbacterium sp. STN6]
MTESTATTTDPAALLAVYRARRELAVTQPQGNLALVNTQWITGDADVAGQAVWGVPGLWSPLPEGRSGLKVTAAASDNIVVDGEVVDGEAVVRGKDDAAPSSVVFSDTVTGFVIHGDEGYALRVWDAASEDIQNFGSIDTFDYNREWVIQGRFTQNPEGTTIGFEHLKDDGKTREMVIPGEITFSKDGVDYNLAAFKAGRALQLVFADATSGDTSYSVGRFLFVAPNADGTITLDFNRAVLPPCAFSYNFNCPMPPRQNRFAVPIEAGEKNVLNTQGALLHP